MRPNYVERRLLKIRRYTSKAVADDSNSTAVTGIRGELHIIPLVQE